MADNLYEDQTIRQYVMGELEGQTLVNFENALKGNETLQAEVDLFAFLIADANLKRRKHFKSLIPADRVIKVPEEEIQEGNLTAIVNEEKKQQATVVEEPEKGYRLFPALMKLAAAAMLIAALGIGWFMVNNQQVGPTQLAENYLEEVYAAPTVVRGENTEEVWNEAVTAYKESKFDKSAQLIEQVIASGKGKDIHRFYLGLSYLYKSNGDPQKAIKEFKQIKEGYYFESAKWYESLAQLKLNNKVEAKALLEGLKNSTRKVEVEKLLKTL